MIKHYLLNFKTKTFDFRLPINKSEIDELLKNFVDDEPTKNYFKEYYEYTDETLNDLKNNIDPIRFTNFVYLNNMPLGIISFLNLEDEIIICYAIIPSKRGNNYSGKIKEEIYEYIFSVDSNIQQITAFVDKNNINSIKNFNKNGELPTEEIHDKNSNVTYYKYSILSNSYKNGKSI